VWRPAEEWKAVDRRAAGGGKFIDDSPRTGDVMKITSLSEPYLVANWVGARRVPDDTAFRGRRRMTVTSRWVRPGVALAMILMLVAACGGSEDDSRADGTPKGAAFDQAFIDAMVPHHEGAIEMARAAKVAGLSQPDLVKVADDILATQQDEIDRMKEWRADWFGSSTIDPKGAAALGLSESQMGMQHDADALTTSGDVDTDFAQMMITHHQGAIEMAKLAPDNADHDELKALAEAIIGAQEREIEVMRHHASGMDHG
jgi:uncharacterized protein (DUF305 family)